MRKKISKTLLYILVLIIPIFAQKEPKFVRIRPIDSFYLKYPKTYSIPESIQKIIIEFVQGNDEQEQRYNILCEDRARLRNWLKNELTTKFEIALSSLNISKSRKLNYMKRDVDQSNPATENTTLLEAQTRFKYWCEESNKNSPNGKKMIDYWMWMELNIGFLEKDTEKVDEISKKLNSIKNWK